MDYTEKVAFSKSFYQLQLINEKLKNENEKNLISLINFLIPSIEFISLLLACMLIYFVTKSFFSSATKLTNQKANKKQNFKIKTLSFFYLLFLFFIQNFFTNNINTGNVIVDTSDLLYSKNKLLDTKKEICFPEKNTEYQDYFVKVSFIENFCKIMPFNSLFKI